MPLTDYLQKGAVVGGSLCLLCLFQLRLKALNGCSKSAFKLIIVFNEGTFNLIDFSKLR